ncbi:hypothetical protein M0805_001782 [Coniferiporia weirii]|nr:hypothetical protein M0805_001782 [Coniferiporia weirii]
MLPRRLFSAAQVQARRRPEVILRRYLRLSLRRCALVGPPDPVSNLRPIIYDEDVPRTRTSPTHPYLLDEFDGNPQDYQWRVERKWLDAYNHAFWTDSNTRFEDAKRAVLSALPENATPEATETALSEFYGNWLRQEHGRLREYSDEWSRRNYGGIVFAARAAIRRFRARVFGGGTPTAASIRPSPPPTPPPLDPKNQKNWN